MPRGPGYTSLMQANKLVIRPAGADSWPAVEKLFGPRGACSGCWCMWWRLERKAFRRATAAERRDGLEKLVLQGIGTAEEGRSGTPLAPGLVAWDAGKPVGWVCVGRRSDFPALASSRVLKPVDAEPVWSIVCLFVDPKERGRGVARALVAAAVDYAGERGGRIVEAYPKDERSGKIEAAAAYTGVVSLYESFGFVEVARRRGRPIMRLGPDASAMPFQSGSFS